MLGFGFGEIILIVMVAIIVLGPDKLPNALIEIVKFLKVIKKTVQDAKDTLDREVNLAELKREAEDYKNKIEQGVDINKELQNTNLISDVNKNMNDIQYLFDEYQPKKSQTDENSSNDSNLNAKNQEANDSHKVEASLANNHNTQKENQNNDSQYTTADSANKSLDILPNDVSDTLKAKDNKL